jgi:hypothetical protein
MKPDIQPTKATAEAEIGLVSIPRTAIDSCCMEGLIVMVVIFLCWFVGIFVYEEDMTLTRYAIILILPYVGSLFSCSFYPLGMARYRLYRRRTCQDFPQYNDPGDPVAQLDRANGFEPLGSEFKSRRGRHLFHIEPSHAFFPMPPVW